MGLARRWLGCHASRAFADFDGRHFGRFPPKAQIFKSLVSTDFTTRARALRLFRLAPDRLRLPQRTASPILWWLRIPDASCGQDERAGREPPTPQTSLERKVTTLLRLVTMSCAPLHLEISEPLQYPLRDIPL
ncbi:hypothetical protein FHX62_000515 [Cupriavidus alkaliphilus]|nr:hypothetical protein [Cupriavidus alkaliphilus]MBB3011888.1 hypothetical protein [Cupriavidus alkaliphilus]